MTDLTYKLDLDKGRISGFADGNEAVLQAAIKTLLTERYAHLIYSQNYGTLLSIYMGKQKGYVEADLPREIREALVYDNRIKSIDNFRITIDRNKFKCTFTMTSIYGTQEVIQELNGGRI